MASHYRSCNEQTNSIEQLFDALGNLPNSMVDTIYLNGGNQLTSKSGIRFIAKAIMKEIGREYDGKA